MSGSQRAPVVLLAVTGSSMLRGVAADACDSQVYGDLVIPLTAWFFITLAGGVSVIVYLLIKRQARKQAGTEVTFLGSMQGSVIAPVRAKQSWELLFRELRFMQRVGIGNVGEVFRGIFRGREIAIKRLLPVWLHDEDMVSRFRDEIALMATMNHPNVLCFIGAVLDRDAGHVCLVTEFCSRGTLFDVLHSTEPLPWRTRLRMGWEIARGMGYLHEQAHVIQRDLKTQNLLVTEHLEVKISDFGLSRGLSSVMETYCGTPATMAPEITRQAVYDERADIFSFGIIMWEILTRQVPYPGMTGLALALHVATANMRPAVPSYCPAEWAALMVRSWDSNPDNRPSFDIIQRELLRMMQMLDEAEAAVALPGSLVLGSSLSGSRIMGSSLLSMHGQGSPTAAMGDATDPQGLLGRKRRLLARTQGRQDGKMGTVLVIPSKGMGGDEKDPLRSSLGGSIVVGVESEGMSAVERGGGTRHRGTKQWGQMEEREAT